MKCSDKTKSKQIFLVLPLILLYIKIIWEAIWAMKMFYPYDLNMSWVIPVIIIDFIMAYFYGKAALNVRMLVSVFINVAILAAPGLEHEI